MPELYIRLRVVLFVLCSCSGFETNQKNKRMAETKRREGDDESNIFVGDAQRNRQRGQATVKTQLEIQRGLSGKDILESQKLDIEALERQLTPEFQDRVRNRLAEVEAELQQKDIEPQLRAVLEETKIACRNQIKRWQEYVPKRLAELKRMQQMDPELAAMVYDAAIVVNVKRELAKEKAASGTTVAPSKKTTTPEEEGEGEEGV